LTSYDPHFAHGPNIGDGRARRKLASQQKPRKLKPFPGWLTTHGNWQKDLLCPVDAPGCAVVPATFAMREDAKMWELAEASKGDGPRLEASEHINELFGLGSQTFARSWIN
jgi:hypothetical protein